MATEASAQSFQAELRVGDPYRGSVYFDSAPSLNIIPGTDVYTIRGNPNYDLYRHDGWYYLVDDGTWYRARSWQGPFTYMPMNTVPNAVVTIPVRYRRTWETESSYSRDDSRDRDYSAGRGYSAGTGRYVITDTRVVPGRRYRGTYLTFRTPPRMSVIPGSRVWYVRDDYDFDRDLYRYNNRWYYVENGVWYVASSWRGPFFTMRWQDVPAGVRRVPPSYRRTWVWARGRDFDDGGRYRAVVRVGDRYRGRFVFDVEPRMSIIPGTSVYFNREESDVDLYRYGNSWYLVDDGMWYRATSYRGPFVRISTGSVPNAVFRIPAGYRKTWVPTID